MQRHRREACSPIRLMREAFTVEQLHELWAKLNLCSFRGTHPAVDIEWSPRLTASSGMFVSRIGPRTRTTGTAHPPPGGRLIQLSLPLLQRQSDHEILSTLAHEMIHQWQFDVLKKRPNHGSDFREKMAAMNRDGLVITVRHDLDDAVRALAKYAWRCLRCGRVYERQRRPNRPRHPQCGIRRGQLRELV